MVNLNYEIQIDSQSTNSIETLENFIREERLKGVQIQLQHEQPEAGKMGGIDPDTLQLIATIAGSASTVALVNGIFQVLKEYIKLNLDDKVTLKGKNKEITFDKDSVENVQQLIEDFIAVEGNNDIEGAEID